MPKNRDYTGLVRTPSSMAWLIGHRAKLKGQLDKAQTLLEELPVRIEGLQNELRAIDAVIPHHRVKVDPEIIQGKRLYAPRILGGGTMTREILRALREATPSCLFTSEIAFRVARRAGVDIVEVGEAQLMDRIGRRLRALAQHRVVVRHHPTSTRAQGSWSLASSNFTEERQ